MDNGNGKFIEVFTYGTLLRGEGNYRVMENAGGEFVCEAVLPGFDMFTNDRFPMIVPGKGVVKGEVFRVDLDGIERLDRLEGVRWDDGGKGGMYSRSLAVARVGKKAKVVRVYIWQLRIDDLRPLEHGDWRKYVAQRFGRRGY